MTLHVRHSGAWRQVNGLWVRDAGSWKRVLTAYVRDAGTWKQFFVNKHVTTVTVDRQPVDQDAFHDMAFTFVNTIVYHAYGYDGGADYFNSSNFGSIGDATYTDFAGNTRTITSTYWTEHQVVYFTLSGAGIPNSDNTFKSISINGNVYNRADATYESGSPTGATTWWWESPAINPFGISGTIPFEVNFI